MTATANRDDGAEASAQLLDLQAMFDMSAELDARPRVCAVRLPMPRCRHHPVDEAIVELRRARFGRIALG